MQLHGGGDLDHLQEGNGALLHTGPTGTRRRHQREPLGSRPFHRRGDPLGSGDADRPGKKVELTRNHRHPAAEDGSLAGQDRFVEPGGGPSLLQLAAIPSVRTHVERGLVPAEVRPLVEDGVP